MSGGAPRPCRKTQTLMTDPDRLNRFREKLTRALSLPARQAATCAEFAPELSYGRHAGPPLPDVRWGAVLVLLYPDATDWNLVLTVRTSHLSSHAGQVSFPGGRIEPDESPELAAVREFIEELGELEQFDIVGRLPDVNVYASNFVVTPVVAVSSRRPRFRPNPQEVADVVELSLAQLADSDRRGEHEIARGPLRFMTPHLEIAGRRVWGATWMILGELLERLQALAPMAGL